MSWIWQTFIIYNSVVIQKLLQLVQQVLHKKSFCPTAFSNFPKYFRGNGSSEFQVNAVRIFQFFFANFEVKINDYSREMSYFKWFADVKHHHRLAYAGTDVDDSQNKNHTKNKYCRNFERNKKNSLKFLENVEKSSKQFSKNSDVIIKKNSINFMIKKM